MPWPIRIFEPHPGTSTPPPADRILQMFPLASIQRISNLFGPLVHRWLCWSGITCPRKKLLTESRGVIFLRRRRAENISLGRSALASWLRDESAPLSFGGMRDPQSETVGVEEKPDDPDATSTHALCLHCGYRRRVRETRRALELNQKVQNAFHGSKHRRGGPAPPPWFKHFLLTTQTRAASF